MYFDEPVFLEKGYILTASDNPITEEMISRLKRWEYEAVYTTGKPVSGPELPLTQKPNEKDKKKTAPAVVGDEEHKTYLGLLDFTKDLYMRFVANNSLHHEHIAEIVKSIIAAVKYKNFVAIVKEKDYHTDNYLISHSLNVGILSVTIGLYLTNEDIYKLPLYKLIELGTSGFLHDLGLAKMPDQLYLSSESLSTQEKATLLNHTLLGYRMLKKFSTPEDVALVAYEHHERLDGSGYPRRLKVDDTGFYSKIVSVACAYDNMASGYILNESFENFSSLSDMMNGRSNAFNISAIKALMDSIPE